MLINNIKVAMVSSAEIVRTSSEPTCEKLTPLGFLASHLFSIKEDFSK